MKYLWHLLIMVLLGCRESIVKQHQYMHSLENIAQQRHLHLKKPKNTVTDAALREVIIRELISDSSGTKWQELDSIYLIQSFSEYPNRYLIADTSAYNLSIIDIPFRTDSMIDLIHLHGKYLGYMIDTTSDATHRYLVMELPVSCTFNINEQESVSYANNGLKEPKK